MRDLIDLVEDKAIGFTQAFYLFQVFNGRNGERFGDVVSVKMGKDKLLEVTVRMREDDSFQVFKWAYVSSHEI